MLGSWIHCSSVLFSWCFWLSHPLSDLLGRWVCVGGQELPLLRGGGHRAVLGLRLAPTRLLLPQLGTSVQSRGDACMGTGRVYMSQGQRTL